MKLGVKGHFYSILDVKIQIILKNTYKLRAKIHITAKLIKVAKNFLSKILSPPPVVSFSGLQTFEQEEEMKPEEVGKVNTIINIINLIKDCDKNIEKSGLS